MAQCKGKRGERWSTVGYTIIMLSILKDPIEGLNHISPRYWTTSSAHA